MASERTRFAPVYFEIYDKSTAELCDRLIVVKPFNYFILAKNKQVWVLDSQMIDCDSHEMAITLAPNTSNGSWLNTCSTTLLSTLVDAYQTSPPITVPINLTKGSFTVIDALNLLFKNYIEVTHTA